MMFFHRHKGDLGEIQGGVGGEPRELRFSGSDGKQEEKRVRESIPHREKRKVYDRV